VSLSHLSLVNAPANVTGLIDRVDALCACTRASGRRIPNDYAVLGEAASDWANQFVFSTRGRDDDGPNGDRGFAALLVLESEIVPIRRGHTCVSNTAFAVRTSNSLEYTWLAQ